MYRGNWARVYVPLALAMASTAANAAAAADFVTVSPVVTSSIQTRFSTFSFSDTDAVEYRAGTAADGGGFESTVIEDIDSIFFRNGAIALGAQGVIMSSTELVITLTNVSSDPIVFNSFESVIIPAGFGLYTTLVSGGCGPLSPTACAYVDSPTTTFQNVARSPDLPPGTDLGRVGFDFKVLVDDVEQYGLDASLALVEVGGVNTLVPDFGSAPTTLANWRESSAPGEAGYAWDATSFTVNLGGQVLLPGQSQSVRYLSTVFAETYAAAGNSALALLGYSAFGDPPTRPGGGGRAESFSAAITPFSTDPDIIGLNIGFFRFAFPTYDPLTGGLSYPPLNVIPEPGTWAMLIAGFGLVGGSLRRRRALIA